MRRTRPVAVAVTLGVAAAIAVSGTAQAAPSPAAKATAVKKAKTIKAIRTQNRSYGMLRAKVIVCSYQNAPGTAALKARAKSELTRTAQLRLNAVAGLRTNLSLAKLNARKASILRASRGLAAVAKLCAAAKAPAVAAPATPATVPGAGTVNQTPVTVGDLLGLGKVLPEGVLPKTLTIADNLVPNLLTATNGVLAFDPTKLTAALDKVIKGTLPACQLLDLGCLLNGTLATVQGLLATVNKALLAGNINELLTVGSLSGNVLQLLPQGALADLLNALPTEALNQLLGTEIGLLSTLAG